DEVFLGDADLLAMLCGTYDQVTGLRSGDAHRGYSLSTVTLAGATAPQAVWTAAATAGEEDWRLTLSGDRGSAVVDGNPASGFLRLSTRLHGQSPAIEELADDGGVWL